MYESSATLDLTGALASINKTRVFGIGNYYRRTRTLA